MSHDKNRQIAKNTVVLYIRMLFVMGVSLYTSREVLSVLGAIDYGIYNVVGGIVVMLAFLNNSMSGATSRFLTFELGKGSEGDVRRIFGSAMAIHAIIAGVVLVIAESIGIWFLENKLVIPEARMNAARIVYQISIIGGVLAILQVPFNAVIIAYENMDIYAFAGMLEAALKIGLIFALKESLHDKLVVFAVLAFGISFISAAFYYGYCQLKFSDARLWFNMKIDDMKPMLAFSGLDAYGNMSILMRTQGVNILMNMFLGPAINASNAIANQVLNATASFADNFLTAIRPQIVKNYASGEFEKMHLLMLRASIYSFVLLYAISLPLIVGSKEVLSLWLRSPPEYSSEFCCIVLVNNLLSIIFRPFMHAIHATGQIWGMSIVNGSIYLLVIPASYVFLKLGFSPALPLVSNIILMLLGSGLNAWRVKKLIPTFPINSFFNVTLLRIVAIVLITVPGAIAIQRFCIENELFMLAALAIYSIIAVGASTYLVGMDRRERVAINSYIKKAAGRC